MSKRPRTDDTCQLPRHKVNIDVENQLRERLEGLDERPKVLSLFTLTEQDAIEADPGEYRLMDLAKTLLYLESGLDGLQKMFDYSDSSPAYMCEGGKYPAYEFSHQKTWQLHRDRSGWDCRYPVSASIANNRR